MVPWGCGPCGLSFGLNSSTHVKAVRVLSTEVEPLRAGFPSSFRVFKAVSAVREAGSVPTSPRSVTDTSL